MAWFIGQSLLIVAAAFLLGMLVGWLIWGRRWRHDRPAAPSHAAAPSTTEAAAEPVPAAVASPDDDAVSVPVAAEPAPAAVASPDAGVVPAVADVSERTAAPRDAGDGQPSTREPEPAVPMARTGGHDTLDAEAGTPADVDAAHSGATAATLVAEQKAALPEPAVDEEPLDNLERIEGIGPQLSQALVAAGIRSYAQLAEADDTTLREAIEARGLRFAPSLVTWAQQARLLADGDEEGFADLTRRLVAGRDEGRQ